jgi:Ca-activated chloride channel family protein
MRDDEVADAFKRLQAPAPDPEARLRAKRAAMAEFERAQASCAGAGAGAGAGRVAPAAGAPNKVLQGFWRSLRPSRDDNHGSNSMNWTRNRGLMAGAAGVCVVALGLTLVWPNLTRDISDVGVDRPAAAASSPPSGLAANATPDLASPLILEDSAKAPTTAGPLPYSRDETGAALAPATARAEVRAEPPPMTANASSEAVGPVRAPVITVSPVAPHPVASEEDLSHIVVTQGRASIRTAVDAKREAALKVDSITAQDISAFPASNLAESVQRIAGVSIAPDPDGKGQVEQGRDRFEAFDLNPVKRVADDPLSTFSADVDTASYSFVRAQLNHGRLPQKDAVRSEEMINYFDYAWPAANSREAPFRPTVVVSDSPWNKDRKLVHVGIKGYELRGETPDANLVLLLDVSGSMDEPNKLPLVIRSMEMLLDSLKPSDTVAIVVYAGAAGTVLEPTPVREKSRIVTALRTLRAGGSTAGAQGIERAYELAERHFRKGGVNRVLLATDGDFNVGIDDTDELEGYIERQRGKGIYLSVLGFGQGNYRDELAQALAQNGNGVAAYIDTENEARKVLVEEASSTLFPIARDVKFQVEFNAATVSEYRLVGYETRALRHEDFNNDAIDAGDIGSGHTVTAIYEITPVGVAGSVDAPRYEGNRRAVADERGAGANRGEYGFVKIRYKLPDEDKSRLISEPIRIRGGDVPAAVERDAAFSTAVAGFAQLLRGGDHTGPLTYDDVIRQAQAARGEDRFGYRAEFIDLVRKAKSARGM